MNLRNWCIKNTKKVNTMVKRIKYRIAIRGGKNKEEGQKVIEILTLLGGKNEENLDGSFGENKLYIIGKGLKIDFVDYPIPETLSVKYKLYTAKEFFLKFPYRVDDWVECKDDNLTGQVTSLFWNEDEGCVVYQVSFGGGVDYGFYKEVALKPTIVREVVNVASALKGCPRGMELYSPICTDLYFDFVDDLGKIHCYIQRKNYRTGISFYSNGTLHNDPQDKCVIFPKGKTTWEGFQRPFKDGDILVGKSNQPFIFKKLNNSNGCYSYCGIDCYGGFGLASTDWTFADSLRFASEEDKQKLFDAIKANGYVWHPNIKCLEKVRIDPGDVAVSAAGNIVLVSKIDEDDIVHFFCRLSPLQTSFEVRDDIGVGKVQDCRLASDKQKQKLFDCLRAKGYRYNPETNALEKVNEPRFTAGNKIRKKGSIDNFYILEITSVERATYMFRDGGFQYIETVDRDYELVSDKYELVSDKFDVHTLKPFQEVLVRNTNGHAWTADFFSHVIDTNPKLPITFVCAGGSCPNQCIPFKGNEYLRGKTDACNDYFKTWE